MAKCQQCGGSASMFATICSNCLEQNARKALGIQEDAVEPTDRALSEAARSLFLSTETFIPDLAVVRLGIVTGTCIYGQHLGRDIIAAWKDVIGGRAAGVEKIFADARTSAMDDLRLEAARLDAGAVIAVSISHQDITGGGKSMVMVSATGTAIRSLRSTDRPGAER